MVEIKFRAWITPPHRMMIYSLDLLHNGKIEYSYGLRTFISKIGKDCKLMQFTGLKDKNGKEIYEGDILIYTRKHWYCPGHPEHNNDLIDQVEVYWDEERNILSTRTFDFERLKLNPNQQPYSSSGSLGNGWNDERADENILEVIGNIYENPKLLDAVYTEGVKDE